MLKLFTFLFFLSLVTKSESTSKATDVVGVTEAELLTKSFETISEKVKMTCDRCAVPTPEPDFCEDPHASICENLPTHRLTQLGRIAELKAQAEEKAFDELCEKNNLKRTPELFSDFKERHRSKTFDSADYKKLSRDDFDRIASEFKDRVEALIWKSAQVNYDEFKTVHQSVLTKNMKRAIDHSNLNRSKKRAFNNYINNADFTSPNAIFSDRENKNFLTLYRRAIEVCNGRPYAQAGDDDQARKDGQQMLIMCNEMYVYKPRSETNSETLGHTFFIGAHELAHIMSYHWEPSLYQNFSKCINENFGQQIVDEYLIAVEANPSIGSDEAYKKMIQDNKGKVVATHLEEISADYWGAQATAEYFENEGKTLSVSEKLNFLRASYGFFCSATASGTHTSGKFRIELMGFDLKIRNALGCKTQSKKPSCGL